jgi:hypothetical protein
MKSEIFTNPNNLLYSTFTKILKSGYVLVYVNVNDRETELFSSSCDGKILHLNFHKDGLDDPETMNDYSTIKVTFDNPEQYGFMYSQYEKDQYSYLFVPRSEFL